MVVNTIEDAIKAWYDPEKDYEVEVAEYYSGTEGDSDELDILHAVDLVRGGDVVGAVGFLNRCDTEVREVFFRMLEDNPHYDWNGNRK